MNPEEQDRSRRQFYLLIGAAAVVVAIVLSMYTEMRRLGAENRNLQDLIGEVRREAKGELAQASGSELASTQIPAPSGYVLEVRLLKIHQKYTYTYVDFDITNQSQTFLSFWHIGANVVNKDSQHLAFADTLGKNLRPGQTVTAQLSFENVKASEVDGWRVQINSVRGQENEDITRLFNVNLKK